MLVERVESNHDAELAEAEADVVAGRMFSLDDVRAQPAKRCRSLSLSEFHRAVESSTALYDAHADGPSRVGRRLHHGSGARAASAKAGGSRNQISRGPAHRESDESDKASWCRASRFASRDRRNCISSTSADRRGCSSCAGHAACASCGRLPGAVRSRRRGCFAAGAGGKTLRGSALARGFWPTTEARDGPRGDVAGEARNGLAL